MSSSAVKTDVPYVDLVKDRVNKVSEIEKTDYERPIVDQPERRAKTLPGEKKFNNSKIYQRIKTIALSKIRLDICKRAMII